MSIKLDELDNENKEKLKSGIIISSKNLLGYILLEASRCRTYWRVPRNISYIERDVKLVIKNQFTKSEWDSDFIYKEFKDYNDLMNWIEKNILELDSIKELNLSEYEFRRGINFGGVRKATDNKVLNDFVDIYAFGRNVCQDLIRDYLEIDFSSFRKEYYN